MCIEDLGTVPGVSRSNPVMALHPANALCPYPMPVRPCLAGGWDASWKWPVVAAVVIIAFVIALLVFIMNVSLKQQSWLLYEMVATNKELALTTRDLQDEKACMARTNKELAITTSDLQAEKARMDAMLVRQYNLIQCFSNPKATGNDLSPAESTAVGEGEGCCLVSLTDLYHVTLHPRVCIQGYPVITSPLISTHIYCTSPRQTDDPWTL